MKFYMLYISKFEVNKNLLLIYGEIEKVEVYDAYKTGKVNKLGFKFVFYTNTNEKIEVKCIEDKWSEEQRKMEEMEEVIKRKGIPITYSSTFKIKGQFQY
ncbi:hypothetical protein ACIGHG_02820 [Bacillus sp. NPDC077411]|uniref:hypothetical protein n=1 Tax=Bacillus sp. NPDC077411 TaxID=3363947 RepID=UPI0037C970B0